MKQVFLITLVAIILFVPACKSDYEHTSSVFITGDLESSTSLKDDSVAKGIIDSEDETRNEIQLTLSIPVTEGPHLTSGETTESYWSYEKQAGYYDEQAASAFFVTIDEVTLEGQYDFSYVAPGNSYICDVYTSNEVWFGVNRDTDKVIEVAWKKPRASNDQVLTNVELTAIAEAYLGTFIDRSSYYVEDVTKEEEGPFHLQLRKTINGIPTTATARISLRRNGAIMSFSVNMVDEIQELDETLTEAEENQLISLLCDESIVEQIDEEIRSITPKLFDYSTNSYLTIDENRQPCMYIAVTANIRENEGNNYYSEQSIRYNFFVRIIP